MFRELLPWIWLPVVLYLAFRFRRRNYWIMVLRLAAFLFGAEYGLRWADFMRKFDRRDLIGLLDDTPIGVIGFRIFLAFIFGLAAIRLLEDYILPYLQPPDPPENE